MRQTEQYSKLREVQGREGRGETGTVGHFLWKLPDDATDQNKERRDGEMILGLTCTQKYSKGLKNLVEKPTKTHSGNLRKKHEAAKCGGSHL